MEWMTTLSEWLRPMWTIWLFAVFVAIVFWAFRPGNKARFEADARIVFKDERNGG